MLWRTDTLSAAAVRGWYNRVFKQHDLESEFLGCFLSIVHRHRVDDAEDEDSVSVLREVGEVFKTMGMVKQEDFWRIMLFVDEPVSGGSGSFMVPSQIPLVPYSDKEAVVRGYSAPDATTLDTANSLDIYKVRAAHCWMAVACRCAGDNARLSMQA